MKSRNTRMSVVGLLITGAVGLAAFTNTTGAYFTDAKSGIVTGTVGSIKITGSGGSGTNGLDLTYNNLLPGEPQTATATFTNSGANAEDVWITFPNATALSALNSLGNYGLMTVQANADAKFISANLNDNTVSCPPGASNPGHMPHPQNPCNALPSQIKLFSNVGPGGSGQVSLIFSYVSYLGGSGGGVFNAYPLPQCPTIGNCQMTVNAGDGSGAGLPYNVVATQVGQTP